MSLEVRDQHVERADDLIMLMCQRTNCRAKVAHWDGAGELGHHDVVDAVDLENRVQPRASDWSIVRQSQRNDDAGVEVAEQVRLAIKQISGLSGYLVDIEAGH